MKGSIVLDCSSEWIDLLIKKRRNKEEQRWNGRSGKDWQSSWEMG
jgi:hypothetical protein